MISKAARGAIREAHRAGVNVRTEILGGGITLKRNVVHKKREIDTPEVIKLKVEISDLKTEVLYYKEMVSSEDYKSIQALTFKDKTLKIKALEKEIIFQRETIETYRKKLNKRNSEKWLGIIKQLETARETILKMSQKIKDLEVLNLENVAANHLK